MHREITVNYKKSMIRFIALLISALLTITVLGGCSKKENVPEKNPAENTENTNLTTTPASFDDGTLPADTQNEENTDAPEPTKPEGYSGTLKPDDGESGYIGMATLDDEKDYPLCVYDGVSYVIFDDHAEVIFTFYSDDTLESYKVWEKVPYDGKEYTVTALMDDAFMYFFDAAEIILPNTIETIGEYAFASCESLTTLDIPASVKSIGRYAFSDCTGLQEITIPKTVEKIGDALFCDCTGLVDVTIEAEVAAVPDECFSGCESLKNVNLPKSVNYIGTESFWYCEAIESLTINEGVTAIGERAFYSCSELKSIKLPKSMTSIAADCFDYCDNLEEFIVPESELEYYENFLAGYEFTITTY